MDRGRGHRTLPHCKSDLIKPLDDIADGIKTGDRGFLLGINDDATRCIALGADRYGKIRTRAGAEGHIERIEQMLLARLHLDQNLSVCQRQAAHRRRWHVARTPRVE